MRIRPFKQYNEAQVTGTIPVEPLKVSDVNNAVTKYRRENGSTPTTLRIGRQERQAINNWAYGGGTPLRTHRTPMGNEQVFEILIEEIDADTHFEVVDETQELVNNMPAHEELQFGRLASYNSSVYTTSGVVNITGFVPSTYYASGNYGYYHKNYKIEEPKLKKHPLTTIFKDDPAS